MFQNQFVSNYANTFNKWLYHCVFHSFFVAVDFWSDAAQLCWWWTARFNELARFYHYESAVAYNPVPFIIWMAK